MSDLSDAFRRIDALEERVEMLETPWWRRLLFAVNGWPRLPVTVDRQAWRFWHRWTALDRGERLLGRRDR